MLGHFQQQQNIILFCCYLVVKSCPALCFPMDCSQPGFSVHGISQARILESVAISSSKGSYQPRNQIGVSCIGRRIFFYSCANRETITLYRNPQVYLTIFPTVASKCFLLLLKDAMSLLVNSSLTNFLIISLG